MPKAINLQTLEDVSTPLPPRAI